jgi:hypothetical protein
MSRRLLVALVAVIFLLGSATPLCASQAAPKQQPAKKAKKIWTNEDLAALAPGGISTSSAPVAPASTSADKPEADKKDKDEKDKSKEEDPVEKLRKRLEPLRADLTAVEAQLRSLRSAGASGNTTGGGVNISQTAGGVNTADQISLLEQRRTGILRQIADIEDEARRKGIAPGAIR